MNSLDIHLEFRHARPEDHGPVLAIVNSVYHATGGRQWTSEADLVEGPRLTETMYLELVNTPGSLVLLGLDKNVILACVHLRFENGQCHLGMLSVSADHQQYGIGAQLLKHAEAHALSQPGIKVITMNVISIRHELLEWYKRRGYKPTGEKIPFGGHAASLSREKKGKLFFEVLKKTLF